MMSRRYNPVALDVSRRPPPPPPPPPRAKMLRGRFEAQDSATLERMAAMIASGEAPHAKAAMALCGFTKPTDMRRLYHKWSARRVELMRKHC